MASGKTTLGRALAAAVPGLVFIDLDEAVEAEAGCSVSDIFSRQGEECFRNLESRALQRLAQAGAVIACGGGTPCRRENMDFMLETGTVVRLETSTATIVRRLLEAPAGKRPLIDSVRGDAAALARKVEDMKAAREPAYSRAPFVFDSGKLETVDEVAASVDTFIRQFIKTE